jgi:hypothetical protein
MRISSLQIYLQYLSAHKTESMEIVGVGTGGGQYDEDYYTGPAMPDRGAGCPISDPGEYEDGF